MEATAPASTLLTLVHGALANSPYLSPDSLHVETSAGTVRLHGQVGTFFQKQMAQELLRRLDGVERIENMLQVNW